MKTGHIKSKMFRAAPYRIDPSFHLSEGIKVRRMLDNVPYGLTTVGDASDKVFIGNIFSRVFVKDVAHGVPYLAASDTVLSNLNTGRYLSKKQAAELSYLILKKDWILATCSGTLGNVTYTNEEFDGRIATHDLIRIVPNDKNVLRGCLYAFLASKYGYYQLTESKFGGVVKHINADHAKNISVPLFPKEIQQKADSLIKEAARLREEAAKELESVECYFLLKNNISLPSDLLAREEKKTSNTRIISFDKIKSCTIKAMNYSLRSQKILEYLSQLNHIILDDYLETPFRMGVRASFKRIGSSYNGEDIVSQSDIHKQNPKDFKKVRVNKENDNCRARRGTIIMPSAGTLGESEVFTKPLLVRSNFEGKLLSEVIGIFNCKSEEDAAYLYVFLSSKIGFRLLRNMASGTNLMYPIWSLMKNIPVPMCSKEDKKDISSKVLSAFDKRGLADSKENEAISLVEAEIEKWNN